MVYAPREVTIGLFYGLHAQWEVNFDCFCAPCDANMSHYCGLFAPCAVKTLQDSLRTFGNRTAVRRA